MRDFASIMQFVGFLAYSLPVVWCATMLLLLRAQQTPVHTIRRFQKMGPALGIALGACIFGGMLGVWLDHGAFELRFTSESDRLEAAIAVTFFLVWVSNIKLEIWTLDPIRKLDQSANDDPFANPKYHRAATSFTRHVYLHALGVISVLLLSFVR